MRCGLSSLSSASPFVQLQSDTAKKSWSKVDHQLDSAPQLGSGLQFEKLNGI